MTPDFIRIQMMLIGARQAAAEAGMVSKAVQGTGTATAAAGTAASRAAPGYSRSARAMAAMKRAASVLGPILGIALGVGIVKSVNAAVDLGEQINKTRVVFRGSEKDVLGWSKSTATAFGISRRQALESAGTFGNMLVPMGFARRKAGDMSRGLVELAADMASFNNASPEETLEALRSGLAGETEPLRKYGVFLNEARIQSEAAAMGIAKMGTELTPQQKAMATYGVIMGDTADAHGDFARTSDSLANQQRILRAQLENLGAKIGKVLIPVLTSAATKASAFFGALEQGEPWAVAIAVGLGVLTAAVLAGAIAWGAMAAAEMIALGWPVLAIAAIAAGFILLYNKVEWFRKAVQFAGRHWKLILLGMSLAFGPVGIAIALMITQFGKIKGVAVKVFNWLKNAARNVANWVGNAFGSVGGAIGDGFNAAKGLVVGFINFLIDQINWVIDKIDDLPGVGDLHEIGHVGGGSTGSSVEIAGGTRGSGGRGRGRRGTTGVRRSRSGRDLARLERAPRREERRRRGRRRRQPVNLYMNGRKVGEALVEMGEEDAAWA